MNNHYKNTNSFGVSRSKNIQKSQPLKPNTQHQQSKLIVPCVDLQNDNNIDSNLIINSTDNYLYYQTCKEWIPLAPIDENNKDNALSQFTDYNRQDLFFQIPIGGNIYFQSNQENILILNSQGISVKNNINHVEIKANNNILPDVSSESNLIRLTINLNLDKDQIIQGTINNSHIKNNSWISITCGGACLYTSISHQEKGLFKYHIKAIDSINGKIILNIEIKN